MCEFKAECPLLVLTEHIAKPCYGACAKVVKKSPVLQVLWELILGRLDECIVMLEYSSWGEAVLSAERLSPFVIPNSHK